MKQCIICKERKPLFDYYAHKKMADGHLNKCKVCCKAQAKERQDRLKNDHAWIELERIRGREKYHRLGETWSRPSQEAKREIQRRYKEKYPEKLAAKKRFFKLTKENPDNELHHWSYNKQHWEDVIEISVADHNLLHRNMEYDQSLYLYRRLDGTLLESKQSHIELWAELTLQKFNKEYEDQLKRSWEDLFIKGKFEFKVNGTGIGNE